MIPNNMNNGGNDVFTGRRTNTGVGHNQAQSQSTNQPQANHLANLVGLASRFAGNLAPQQNTMANLYNYGPHHINYASIIGLDGDIGEEQLKSQALAEGGAVASGVAAVCLGDRRQGVFYTAWRSALERFKSPLRNGPKDPVMEKFTTDIDNSKALNNFIVAHASAQFGIELGYALMTGNTAIRSDANKMSEMFYRCCIDTITLQFIDFLFNDIQSYYRLSTIAKQQLAEREEQYVGAVQSRYSFAGLDCPYMHGRLAQIKEKGTMHNPLIDVANPMDLGAGNNIFDYIGANNAFPSPKTNSGHDDITQWVINRARQSEGSYNNAPSGPVETTGHVAVPATDNYDKPVLNIENITAENRHLYNLNDYATQVGNTGWYILHRYFLDKIHRALRLADGSNFSMADTNVLGKLAVYQFDWQAGTFNYKFINYSVRNVEHMQRLISDPAELLPFMYEEDGVQRTSFDPKAMETSKFVRDNVIVPMEEMKELDKLPDLLVGSKPMVANKGNANTLERIDTFTESYDPTSKLDAFVLPMVNTQVWNLEKAENADELYSRFKLMVKGNKEEKTDTGSVLRVLRGQCREFASTDGEFTAFVETYLTNLVNRWLVEERGYAESKEDTGAPYLRITDSIFADLEELITYLGDNDKPAQRAFLAYGSNDFMRNGIEILMDKEATQKEFETRYKNEDEETRMAMASAAKRKIIFVRESVFINMIKQDAPMNDNIVFIKNSINPELFAIMRKAIEVAGRHFSEYPQVLVKFCKDQYDTVWTLTRSGMDPEGVFVLRAVSESDDYTHPNPRRS